MLPAMTAAILSFYFCTQWLFLATHACRTEEVLHLRRIFITRCSAFMHALAFTIRSLATSFSSVTFVSNLQFITNLARITALLSRRSSARLGHTTFLPVWAVESSFWVFRRCT